MKELTEISLGVFAVALLAFLAAAAVGWVFMLFFGAMWSMFGLFAPIGFWPSMGLGLLVITIISIARAVWK